MKAIVKMPCEDTSCKHNHEMVLDTEELGIRADSRQIPPAQITKIPEIEQTHQTSITNQNDPHDILANNLPTGVNFGKCSNGNCGKKVKNSRKITTKFKACPNCRFNGVPKGSDFCPTCGKEPDEWDESDINIEAEEE